MRIKQKMKLKIMIPIVSFGNSGGYRVLSELANYWIDNDHEVTFVTYYESLPPYFPTNGKIIWINNKGEEVDNNKVPENGKGMFMRILSLWKYIRKNSNEFDIVLANSNTSSFPVYFGSKACNFYYVQAYEPEFYTYISFKGKIQKFLAWFSYYIPITKVVNAEIYRKYKNLKSTYVITPGLNLNIFYPKDLTITNTKRFVIGCIGRKEEWKGSNDVGAAINILHQKGYDVDFKVAFYPVSYEKHTLVTPHGDDKLASFYRSLDILVAPGHLQLGAVHYPVIEAMACNVPVITTGYYPANDQNSFIVPIKNAEKIAENIELIIDNYQLAIEKSKNALQDVESFAWKTVSTDFIDIFTEVLNKKNKGR